MPDALSVYPGPADLGDIISDLETNRNRLSTSIATGFRRIQDTFTTHYSALTEIVSHVNDAETTRAAGIGMAGHEYAPLAQNVTFTLVTPATSDGTLQQGVQVTWTNPRGDYFGDVELVYTPDLGAHFYSLGPSAVSPFTRWIAPPDPAAIWTFYLVSRDIYNRANTINADTPSANIVVGISSSASGGTLDFTKAAATSYDANIFKVQAGKFIVWAMDGSLIVRGTLNVGGGTDRPDKLTVWQDDSTAIGYIGLWGEKTGVVNTNGTAVSRVSGDAFVAGMANRPIVINGVQYLVSGTVTPPNSLVLTATAGVQNGVAYNGWTNAGIWAQEAAFGGTTPATAPFKADTSGNVSVTDATIKVTSGASNIYMDPANGLQIVKNEGTASYELCILTQAAIDLSHLNETLTATPHSVLLTNNVGQSAELLPGFLKIGGVTVVYADQTATFPQATLSRTISGTTQPMLILDSGITAKSRLGRVVNEAELDLLANLSFDGAAYNLDDTGQGGAVIRIRPAYPFQVRYCSAGANPRSTAIAVCTDLNGNTGFGGAPGAYQIDALAGSIHAGNYFSSDGSAGISGTVTLAKLTSGGATGLITYKNGLITSVAPPS